MQNYFLPTVGAQNLHLSLNKHPSCDQLIHFVNSNGRYDSEIMAESVALLLKNNKALCAFFEKKDNCFFQNIKSFPDIEKIYFYEKILESQFEDVFSYIEEKIIKISKGLSISEGYLFKVFHFQTLFENDVLIFLANHLVVDNYSFGVLSKQMLKIYENLIDKKTKKDKYDSFEDYTKYVDYLKSIFGDCNFESNLKPWLKDTDFQVFHVCKNFYSIEKKFFKIENYETHRIQVPISHVKNLEKKIILDFECTISDFIVLIIINSLVNEKREVEFPAWVIMNGRESSFSELDISRVVGFLSCPVIVRFNVDKNQELEAALNDSLLSLKEAKINSLNFIAGYFGDVCPDKNNAAFLKNLRSIPYPEVLVNYVGKFQNFSGQEKYMKLSQNLFSKENHRCCGIESVFFFDSLGLNIEFKYIKDAYSKDFFVEAEKYIKKSIQYFYQ